MVYSVGSFFLAVIVLAVGSPFSAVGSENKNGVPSNPITVRTDRPIQACMQLTPFDFGAIGDGIADDTKALQTAVEAAIKKQALLTSPMSAVYAVSSPIEIHGRINADFNLAEIRALTHMTAVIRYETPIYYTLIRNLRIDGNQRAQICFSIVNARKMRIDNLITGRHLNTALKIEAGYEIFVQNAHFNGGHPDTITKDSAEKTVGIDIATSDCHFSDIVIIDCKTAVSNRGFNFYDRIHAWTYKPSIIKDSICFDLWSGCVISGGYADTFQTCFRLRRKALPCKLSGCYSFYNEELYATNRGHVTPYLFWIDEGDGRDVSLQASYMRGSESLGGHYSNIETCAVYTDNSNNFFRWSGVPKR